MILSIFAPVARIIGIDYGTKRVGLAATDPLQIIVNPLETVETAELMAYLENYFKTEAVECIVVGEPMHRDGNPTYLTPIIEAFILKFKNKFPSIRVERQNEGFTSQEARNIILQSGLKKKKRRDKGLVDTISAVLILQDFLNHRY